MVLSSMDLASSDASDPEASPAIQIAVSCHLTGYTRPFPLPLTVKSRVAMFSRLACLVAAMTFSAIVAAESDSTQLAVATATLTRTRGAHVSPRNPCRMKSSSTRRIGYSPCKAASTQSCLVRLSRKSRNFPNSGLERCTSKLSFDSHAADFRSHTRT